MRPPAPLSKHAGGCVGPSPTPKVQSGSGPRARQSVQTPSPPFCEPSGAVADRLPPARRYVEADQSHKPRRTNPPRRSPNDLRKVADHQPPRNSYFQPPQAPQSPRPTTSPLSKRPVSVAGWPAQPISRLLDARVAHKDPLECARITGQHNTAPLGCFTMRTPVRIRTGFLTATPVDSKQAELRGLQYFFGLD